MGSYLGSGVVDATFMVCREDVVAPQGADHDTMQRNICRLTKGENVHECFIVRGDYVVFEITSKGLLTSY